MITLKVFLLAISRTMTVAPDLICQAYRDCVPESGTRPFTRLIVLHSGEEQVEG
jgi:hypothetical protein